MTPAHLDKMCNNGCQVKLSEGIAKMLSCVDAQAALMPAGADAGAGDMDARGMAQGVAVFSNPKLCSKNPEGSYCMTMSESLGDKMECSKIMALGCCAGTVMSLLPPSSEEYGTAFKECPAAFDVVPCGGGNPTSAGSPTPAGKPSATTSAGTVTSANVASVATPVPAVGAAAPLAASAGLALGALALCLV
jgi:hypothetical protein